MCVSYVVLVDLHAVEENYSVTVRECHLLVIMECKYNPCAYFMNSYCDLFNKNFTCFTE